jgi:predicted MFS family arabinose efflux permease
MLHLVRPMTGRLPLSAVAPMLAILYALNFANLFLRSTLGVLAPELSREMALSPAMLSVVASSFFFAYAAMQVPAGMLLDRFGARRTMATMLLFATAGAATFALADSPAALIAGRVLMGIGCAGLFTGAFFAMTLWFLPDRVVTHAGIMNSVAGLGTLCATAPLAALVLWIGWRPSFWIFTAGVGVLLLAVALFLRDAPPGGSPPASRGESLGQTLTGVRAALRQPGIWRLLFIGLPLAGSATLSGAWAAPYLRDVHGLGDLERGNVLLAMACCAVAGHVVYGQIARRLNTLKGVIVAGGVAVFAVASVLALLPHPPLALVVALFCTLVIVATYPSMALAHARGLASATVAGRTVAVVNMGVMAAIALMQFAFGMVVGAFPAAAGVPPEHAYRAAFAVLAAASALALLIYLPVRDVRPRG